MSTEDYINFDFVPFKPSPETARAISTITEYSELTHLCEKLELEELVIAYEYVKKLIASRPKPSKGGKS